MVENKKILADIKYLSQFCHTGNLEVFHSVLNKYCRKRLHFILKGMVARTQLVVLNYNCGSNNTQATTKDGKRRYKQIFSKVTQNWVVKKMFETEDWEYIHELSSFTLEASPDTTVNKLPRIGSILSNIAPSEKPDKEEAIENMKTRFKILFYFLKNTFIYKIIAKHFYYIMNIVFVACSVYLHFIFYTITITKLRNDVYILLKRNYKFYR